MPCQAWFIVGPRNNTGTLKSLSTLDYDRAQLYNYAQ